ASRLSGGLGALVRGGGGAGAGILGGGERGERGLEDGGELGAVDGRLGEAQADVDLGGAVALAEGDADLVGDPRGRVDRGAGAQPDAEQVAAQASGAAVAAEDPRDLRE